MISYSEEYKNTILAFKGPININVLSFFGNYLKLILNNDFRIINKIYRVFIELTQNVSFYSAERHEMEDTEHYMGIGNFEVYEEKDIFHIKTGNVILKKDGEKLQDYCAEINRLDIHDLRQLKRKVRSQSDLRDIGAHIGLIHVGIITCNDLEFKIKTISEDFSYFSILAKVNKNYTDLTYSSKVLYQ